MTTQDWLLSNTRALQNAGIDSARLDCLILLEDVTARDRAWLLAHPEHQLDELQVQKLQGWTHRRSEHVPMAYIRDHSEFYGRRFTVTPQVLVPRPESESMIDVLKGFVAARNNASVHTKTSRDTKSLTIIDIGTGSGALAITAALEITGAHVIGCDIDPQCLTVAHANAQALGANCDFVASDLLSADLRSQCNPPTVILANLPYVPTDYPINRAASHEPATALFAGADGLNDYRRLWAQLTEVLPEAVITESLEDQHPALAALAAQAGYRLNATDGLAQLFIPIY